MASEKTIDRAAIRAASEIKAIRFYGINYVRRRSVIVLVSE